MDFLSQAIRQSSLASSLALILLSLVLLRILRTCYLSPLRKFPGPFLYPTTDIWRLVYTYRQIRNPQLWIDMHRKYGEVVRLGPDMLSFGSPEAARDIYGAGKNFKKVRISFWSIRIVI